MLNITLKDIKQYLLSIRRDDFLNFLWCLLLALLFWLLNALAVNYNNSIVFNLKYQNPPLGKVVLNKSNLPEKIEINIKGVGRDLLWYNLDAFISEIEVDFESLLNIKKGQDKAVINDQQLYKLVAKKLDANVDILSVNPKEIHLNLDEDYSKRMAVKIVSKNNDFQAGVYDVKFQSEPDSVDIAGPKKILKHLNFWLSDTVDVSGINQPKRVLLNLREEEDIKVFPNKVQVNIEPDKFTESEFDIPIRKVHIPDNLNFNLHQKKAKVIFNAPMSKLEKVEPKHFRLVADFSDLNWRKESKIQLEITKNPSYVQIVNIEPSELKFTIEK